MPEEIEPGEEIVGDIPVPAALAPPPAPPPVEPEPGEEIIGEIPVPAILKAPPPSKPLVPPIKPEPKPPPKPAERTYEKGSTMHDLGFRTEGEYLAAQTHGVNYGIHEGKLVPKDSFVLTDPRGKPQFRATPGELKDQPALSGWIKKEQYKIPVETYKGTEGLLTVKEHKTLFEGPLQNRFAAMQKADIIPPGALFTGLDLKGNYHYFSVKQVAEIKKETPDLYKILVKDGYKAYQRTAVKKRKEAVKVIDKLEIKPPPKLVTKPEPEKPLTVRERMIKRVKAGDILIHKAPTSAELKILKENFGLTQAEIDAARKAYLEAPDLEVPEGEPPKVSLGLLSLGVARALADPAPKIAKLPFSERWARAWEALFKAEKAKVKMGTEGVATGSTIILTDLRSQIKDKLAGMPAFIREPSKFLGGLAVGSVIAAPAYSTIFTGNLVQCAWAPDRVKAIKDVGTGVSKFLLSIPAMVAAEPTLASGELIGMFFVGPEGAIRIATATKARLSPHFIPERGIAIEYSVTRVPTKIVSEPAVMKAVNKAIAKALTDPQGKATVKIGNGRIALKLRSTPVSEIVGPALYHATPLITKELIRGKVKGKLYASPQAAPRFADSSAKGTPGTEPAIMMIYPKKGNPKWKPTSVFYKGTKEIEAVYPTIDLVRVRNLNSRIFGAKAGEFITVHKGKVIPIYRFAEKGAIVPTFGIAELLAVRIKATQAAFVDLVKGRKGFEIIRVEKLKDIRVRIAEDIKVEIRKGKSYKEAVEVVKRRELGRLYNVNPRALERLYRQRGERFEQEYMRYLNRGFREARGTLTSPIRIRPPKRPPVRDRIPPVRDRVPPREIPPREIPPREIPLRERPPREIPPREIPLRERPPREIPPREIPLRERPPPRKRATDKEKRKLIKEAEGAIAWRHGELHGKDVWHIFMAPYNSEADFITVMGRKPDGATIVKGPGSAYQTITLLRGKPPSRKVTGDIGFFDFSIEPKDGRKVGIGFTPDPKMETTGDITIGKRTPPITERQIPLSKGRGIRITPKTPMLRR